LDNHKKNDNKPDLRQQHERIVHTETQKQTDRQTETETQRDDGETIQQKSYGAH